MQQNRGKNGNIYDLRRDLQRPSAPSQGGGSSGSTSSSRYGFNGEPLSRPPERTANGTIRRTRTDNSIEFPTQPRTTQQSTAQPEFPAAQPCRPANTQRKRAEPAAHPECKKAQRQHWKKGRGS